MSNVITALYCNFSQVTIIYGYKVIRNRTYTDELHLGNKLKIDDKKLKEYLISCKFNKNTEARKSLL